MDDNASQDLACGRLSDDDDDDEDKDDEEDDEDEEEEGEGEFTRGASLLAALDNQAVELEAKAQELLELYRANCGAAGEGEEHDDDQVAIFVCDLACQPPSLLMLRLT